MIEHVDPEAQGRGPASRQTQREHKVGQKWFVSMLMNQAMN